jgi:hypothetical protein
LGGHEGRPAAQERVVHGLGGIAVVQDRAAHALDGLLGAVFGLGILTAARNGPEAGAFAQLEKARLVAKLKAARDHKKAQMGKCGGRKSYAEARPEIVALVKELHGQRLSYRKISAELAQRGHLTGGGRPYVASAIQAMLRTVKRDANGWTP